MWVVTMDMLLPEHGSAEINVSVLSYPGSRRYTLHRGA